MITRKKLTELEEENESLNIQLHKLSSAKTLKFTARKSTDEPEVITEREHEMKLQMELADSEVQKLTSQSEFSRILAFFQTFYTEKSWISEVYLSFEYCSIEYCRKEQNYLFSHSSEIPRIDEKLKLLLNFKFR